MAIAIVAALSVFFAVTTGWALRSEHGTAAPPQPAVWSHAQAVYGSQSANHHGRPTVSLHGSSPTNHKPAKNAWMTRDRPPTWAQVAPQLARGPQPVVSVAAPSRSGIARSRAPATAVAGQDILILLGVTRR